MFNFVGLQGRFPSSEKFMFKYTPENNGKKAYFMGSISVQRNYKAPGEQYPKEDIFEIRAFGKTADMIGKYFNRGDVILLEGELQNTDLYEKEDGTKVYPRPYISVNRVQFQYSNKKNTQESTAQTTAPVSSPVTAAPSYNYAPPAQTGVASFNFKPTPQASPF